MDADAIRAANIRVKISEVEDDIAEHEDFDVDAARMRISGLRDELAELEN